MKKTIIIFSITVSTLILALLSTLLIVTLCTHTHEFGDWETVTEATCSETGVKKRYCECGETETEAIAKKNHNIELIPEVNPTCTTKGKSEGTYCKTCGKVIEAPKGK